MRLDARAAVASSHANSGVARSSSTSVTGDHNAPATSDVVFGGTSLA